jgi:acyl carrier protein phosphodiesterase
MNYLAHAFLSPQDELILLGNLSADSLSKDELETLHPRVRKGMQLHYNIDETTDRHPEFRKACKILSNQKIKYSGAIVDILFDHFLAADWNLYSDIPFEKFCTEVYRTMTLKELYAPYRFKKMAPWIISENWFNDYRTIDGLFLALTRFSYRTKYKIDIDDILKIFIEQKMQFSQCFNEVITGLRIMFRSFES